MKIGGGIINNSFNDLFDYINDNNNQNKLIQKKKNKKLILCLNLLGIMLLIGGWYGIKYI